MLLIHITISVAESRQTEDQRSHVTKHVNHPNSRNAKWWWSTVQKPVFSLCQYPPTHSSEAYQAEIYCIKIESLLRRTASSLQVVSATLSTESSRVVWCDCVSRDWNYSIAWHYTLRLLAANIFLWIHVFDLLGCITVVVDSLVSCVCRFDKCLLPYILLPPIWDKM